jgi:hypothetical protein
VGKEYVLLHLPFTVINFTFNKPSNCPRALFFGR